MRKFTLALIAALIPVSAMSADFSGTWVRDSARSKPVPYPNYWLTRVTPGAGGGQNQLYVMRIQQSATDVQISDPLHNLRSYALDGKPRGSRTDTGMGNVTTTAAMAGDTMTVTTVQPYGGMPGNVTVTATERWALSADGTELTITTVSELPATRLNNIEVFKKQ